MKLLNNQNGSVLVTALIMIAVLLTLFLSAFSFGIARYSVQVKRNHEDQAMYLAESGINCLLTSLNTQQIDLEQVVNDSLFKDIPGIGEFCVTLRPYGGYLLVRSLGSSGSQSKSMYALLGNLHKEITDNALTILGRRFPIVATTNTQIAGDIYSPSVQLTTGQIEGRSIVNENFHTGKRIIVDSIASPFNHITIIDDYSRYVFQHLRPMAGTVSNSLYLSNDSSYFSDLDILEVQGNLELIDTDIKRTGSSLTILVNGWVEIKGKSNIQGLVEIVSEKSIRLSGSAHFAGGVLYAEDSISIQDNTYFSAQAISRHQLKVADLSVTAYPSLLLTYNDVLSDRGDYGIRVSSDMPVTANIVYISTDTLKQRNNESIVIDSNVVITGVVFSSDYLNLQSTVVGSVAANSLRFEIPPTTYVNWLNDVNIDRRKLDYRPVMPLSNQDSSLYCLIYPGSSYE